MKIAIDLDDTITYFVDSWLNKYNDLYDDNLKREHIKEWNIAKFTKCGNKIYDLLYLDEIYKNAKARPMAKSVLKWLNKRATLYIVTAYNHKICNAKGEWIEKNFPFFNISNLVFCNDKSNFMADYLIDDKYENVRDFKAKGFLFGDDNPWNYYYYFDRLLNWKSVFHYFSKIL